MDYSRDFLSDLSGKKKALVIGLSYLGSKNPLPACVVDAHGMKETLIQGLGYAQENVLLITDEDRENLPTKERILEAMRNLVVGAKANQSLFYFFSGHGIQIEDQVGDEWDSKDECIRTLDELDKLGRPRQQYITDDEMYDILVRGLPVKCRLTAVYNCCHSGTILDLPYEYDENGELIKPNPTETNFFGSLLGKGYKPKINEAKKTPPKDVVCFSACKDPQDVLPFFNLGGNNMDTSPTFFVPTSQWGFLFAKCFQE